MKKLLVPVDFSEQSISAFRFALDIAAKSGGEIILLHVIDLPVLQESPRMPVDRYRRPWTKELQREVHQRFCALIQEHQAAMLNISADVVMSDHVQRTIAEYAEKRNIDLLVMGTKGASGTREWLTGSNTQKIVRTSRIPVIAIKKYTPATRIKNIVFPNTLDTGDQEDLVTKIKVLQNFFGAQLHIVWINTPVLFKPEAVMRKRLKAFADRHMLEDYTTNVFNCSDEETGIVEYTRQINGDLIAMGTHGLTGLAHFFAGSITEDVVNHVKYPVWTYCMNSATQTKNA